MASGNLKSTTHKKQVIVMDYTTGAARREARRPAHPSARGGRQGASAESGLRNALQVTLIRMRHGAVQTVIGEQLGMSQPTVSRAVRALTDTIVRTLKNMLLTAEEVPENRNFRAGRQPPPLLELAEAP